MYLVCRLLLECSRSPRYLHSFPTRRSSDLLISAGIESSGDVVAATLTLFAVRLGGRPADHGHPYGHRRAENLGALGESVILLTGGAVVSVEIGRAHV